MLEITPIHISRTDRIGGLVGHSVVSGFSSSGSHPVLNVLGIITNVTGKRNAQVSETPTSAKTIPLSTTPYNVATT
jgi:hypothetical protein